MLSFFNSKKTYIVDTNQRIIKFTNFFLVKSTFLAIISSFLQILYLINLPLLLIKFAFSKKNMPKKNQKIEHLNVAYLRTTDSYNLRSGGSLGHTLGILDGFNDLVNNIHFFGIDKLQDINKDIKSTIFRPSRFLNYVNISNRLIFSQYFFNKLKNYFSSNNYDIIYQRLSRDDISGALLSRFFKIPLIVEYNSSMSWEVKNSSFFIEKIFVKITKILEKIMLNQASIIIAVSSVLKDELEKKGYNNVFVVTNGVNANVSLLSHSFSRGSAIFETFGVHKGTSGPVVFRMDQHLKRLKNSADLLGMELKYGIPEIGEAVAKTIIANNTMRGVVKIMAFWGEEAIVNMVPSSKLDVAIFSLNKNSNLPLDNDTPLRACLSNWRKLDPRSIPVEAKAVGNYLNGYLARREAKDRGYDLSFMLGTDGFLAEGSIESIFLVKKNIEPVININLPFVIIIPVMLRIY